MSRARRAAGLARALGYTCAAQAALRLLPSPRGLAVAVALCGRAQADLTAAQLSRLTEGTRRA